MNRPQDDSLLTAYAIGELDPEQCRAVEERLMKDPAALDEVEAIAEMASLLDEVYAQGAVAESAKGAGARAGDHLRVVDGEGSGRVEHEPAATRRKASWLRVIPGSGAKLFMLAAAAVLLFVGVWGLGSGSTDGSSSAERAQGTAAPAAASPPAVESLSEATAVPAVAAQASEVACRKLAAPASSAPGVSSAVASACPGEPVAESPDAPPRPDLSDSALAPGRPRGSRTDEPRAWGL